MCWPCCHPLIWRFDPDGNLLWTVDWDTPVKGWVTQRQINGVATDGTDIYAVGSRASSTPYDPVDAYSVVCLDPDGSEKWRHDTGSEATCVVYWPGVGVLIGHEPSHASSDDVAFTGGPGFISDEQLNPFSTPAVSPAATQAYVNSIPRIAGKITITGSSYAGGASFHFHSSLFGPSGRRPVISLLGVTYSPIASAANYTLLNPADGSVIWQKLIGGSFVSGALIADLPRALVILGSKAIAAQYEPLPTAKNIAEIDSGGAATMHGVGFTTEKQAVTRRRLAFDGTNYFIIERTVNTDYTSLIQFDLLEKITSTHTLQGMRICSAADAPIACESTNQVWSQFGSITIRGPVSVPNSTSGSILNPPTAGLPVGGNDFAILGGGKYAVAGKYSGDIVRIYGSSYPYTLQWGYADDPTGYSVIKYPADSGVIVGGKTI